MRCWDPDLEAPRARVMFVDGAVPEHLQIDEVVVVHPRERRVEHRRGAESTVIEGESQVDLRVLGVTLPLDEIF